MIKYAEIKDYKNVGEIQMFSHVYQFIENVEENPKIILIHAYVGETKVFKGFLYNKTKTFINVKLLGNEIKEIVQWCGNLTQVGFDEFIKQTPFADVYKDFRKAEPENV